MSQKRLAIVTDTVPYPLRSGDHTRISEMISVLRHKGWCVHLVVTALLDGKSRRLCLEHVDRLHHYRGKTPKVRFRNFVRLAARLFDRIGGKLGLPLVEDMAAGLVGNNTDLPLRNLWLRYQDGLDEYLEDLNRKYNFRAVILENIWLYKAKNRLRSGVLKILDTHDIQHLRIKEFACRDELLPLRIDRERESQIFNQFDAVIAIQEQEAGLIREMCPDKTVLTVGCGAALQSCSDHKEMIVPGRILYVGGYNKPNSDGLRYFLEHSWPKISAACSDAHLRVCGNVYRSFINKSYERTEFLRVVEDIGREYWTAEIVINPIWIGTGLKIKTVEALANGKPLITTPKGVEGMRGKVSKSCFVVVAMEDFAEAVVALLQNKALAHHYAWKASEYAAKYLSVEAVYKDLLGYLERSK